MYSCVLLRKEIVRKEPQKMKSSIFHCLNIKLMMWYLWAQYSWERLVVVTLTWLSNLTKMFPLHRAAVNAHLMSFFFPQHNNMYILVQLSYLFPLFSDPNELRVVCEKQSPSNTYLMQYKVKVNFTL